MPSLERYLDSSKILRQIEEAQQRHNLDETAARQKITEAMQLCKKESDSFKKIAEFHTVRAEAAQRKSDAYYLAMAAYAAEIKRRVEKEHGFGSWTGWANEHRDELPYGPSYTMKLATIGQSAYPHKALAQYRTDHRRSHGNKGAATRMVLAQADTPSDPLAKIKLEWAKLAPAQMRAFHWYAAQYLAGIKHPKNAA